MEGAEHTAITYLSKTH